MANPPIPAITKRAPTIDFIDQQLPSHHALFATPGVGYDTAARQYVPNGPSAGATTNSLVSAGIPSTPSGASMAMQRPEWTDTKAMISWTEIFPDSMSRFKSSPEPKGRSKTPYNIRDKTNWHSVYDILELAQNKYESSGGSLRRARRKIADKVTPGADAAKIGSKVAPQDNIATPVIGVVSIILDAVKTSASVRNEVLEGFDGLVPIFSDIELFLSTFKDDANIRKASVDLTAATLASVERAIGFFISNELARAGSAILSGGDYQKDLIESLNTIQTKSRDLIQQALKSHMFEFHMYSQETRKIYAQMDEKTNFIAREAMDINSKLDIVVDGKNSIEKLLNELWQRTDRKLQERDRKLQERDQKLQERDRKLQERDRYLEEAWAHLRIQNGILRSTSPIQPSRWLPPAQSTSSLVPSWFISQETLRNMIDAFDIDLADLDFIQERKEQLPSRDRSRAEQMTNTPLFRNWIVSSASTKLLVHWDRRLPKSVAQVTPLTVFCMTMAKALRSKPRILSALWFCGQHTDLEQPQARSGGQRMISSLLDQLLRQWQFDTGALHSQIDREGLQRGDVEALTALLGVLVRQLPPQMVLFLIIDGAVLFERDEIKDALPVFSSLIRLVADDTVDASVKLLITSTPGTEIVRGAFEGEDLILNVENLQAAATASEERTARELEGGL